MLSEPLVKLNSVYVKVQEALLHLRGDLLVGDTGVVGKAVGGTARIFDAPAFYAQQVRQILRKFGSDAHLFMPGPGVPILGPELVVNGDFSNGTTGWSGSGLSVSGGELVVTADGVGNYVGGTQIIQCVVGKKYTLSVTGRRGTTSGDAALYAAFATGGATITAAGFNSTTSNKTVSYEFVASGNGALTLTPHIGGAPSPAGTAAFDNVTLKEILGYTNYLNGFAAGNYIESTGNTNASVDGAVGLVLDAAGSVGSELVAGQAWTTGSANTSISGGNTVVFNGAASGAVGTASIPVVLNKTYQITFTVSGLTAGQIGVDAGGASTYPNIGANGTHTIRTVCTGGAGNVYVVSKAAGTTASVQVTSIRELPGTHATQTTTANKPILRRGIVNLLEYSAKFDDGGWWPSTNLSMSPTTVDGLPAVKMTPTTTNGVHRLSRGKPIQNGGKYTAAVVVKAAGYNYFGLKSGVIGADAPVFNLATGALSQGAGTIADLGGGRYLCCHTFTGNADQVWNSYWTTLATGDFGAESFAGDGVSGTHIFAGGLFQGHLTAQQIIAAGGIPLTTTAPASSQYGAYAWQFDGSNDALALPGPLFQQADDHCVVVAANPSVLDSTYRRLFTQENGSPTVCEISGHITGYAATWRDDAAVVTSIATSVIPVGVPVVLSARKVGNTRTLKNAGVLVGTETKTIGTTTLGPSTYIGNRAAGDRPWNGLVYPTVIIKGTVSDSELKVLEKWLGSIAGVPVA